MVLPMAGRTFAIGDLHGEPEHMETLWSRLPVLDAGDTLVFLGDYLDRGPRPREIIERLMALPERTPAQVICLRGNHEDAWLRVCNQGWDEFVTPPANGCFSTVRSFTGGPPPAAGERPSNAEMGLMTTGSFFPEAVLSWMRHLSYWY